MLRGMKTIRGMKIKKLNSATMMGIVTILATSTLGMMMYQNRAESEQREHQSRIDAEQRDREYQLLREEIAIAHEDSRAQRQLMKVMMMAMQNRNGGGGAVLNHPPAAL